jgi:hypothetical protein
MKSRFHLVTIWQLHIWSVSLYLAGLPPVDKSERPLHLATLHFPLGYRTFQSSSGREMLKIFHTARKQRELSASTLDRLIKLMTHCQLATQPPVIICLVYGKWAQKNKETSPLAVQRGSISLFSAAAGARCFADCFSPEQRRNINISVISTPVSCTTEPQPQRQGATSSLRISNYPAVLRLNSFLRINARSRGRHFACNSVGNSISLSRQLFACTLVCET